jgi:hypothetical protein
MKGKVYCINTYTKEHIFVDSFTFIKGKYYDIIYTNDNYIHIFDDDNNLLKYVAGSIFDTEISHRYFMTTKQLRKEKLKKLNNI